MSKIKCGTTNSIHKSVNQKIHSFCIGFDLSKQLICEGLKDLLDNISEQTIRVWIVKQYSKFFISNRALFKPLFENYKKQNTLRYSNALLSTYSGGNENLIRHRFFTIFIWNEEWRSR